MTAGAGLVSQPTAMQRAGRHWSRYRAGYLFLMPAFLLYAVFMIYPFAQSIYFTFIEWNGADPVKEWVGLQNYDELIRDDRFWNALKHNIIWVVIGTVSPMIIGLLLAMLLWT
ncbi:MAG: sugar ABC transporter permease, partial [Chloroflexota bacterium]|nr:sugar ABC transporter permease [Chloroflexota bacterium]